jgi:hypothetical protein
VGSIVLFCDFGQLEGHVYIMKLVSPLDTGKVLMLVLIPENRLLFVAS